MTTVTREVLLAEIEDILRTMPSRATIRHDIDENFAWLGRVTAVVGSWNPGRGMMVQTAIYQLQGPYEVNASQGLRTILTILHQARHDLRMSTIGPMSVAVSSGGVFDYFDEVRKVIEAASSDLLFVDPYLDAEFVSRYMPHIAQGVTIRLLASQKIATLVPAVQAFAAQSGLAIEVRSAQGLHDRYVFVDKAGCFQSGASFKDGAKKAPTTLTQITDAFAAVQQTYEGYWAGATKHI